MGNSKTHLWGEGGSTLPDSSGSKTLGRMVADGTGGLYVPYSVSSGFSVVARMQQLNSQGNSQFQIGGNKYLDLEFGAKPNARVVETLPLVVYENNGGLFARLIQLADPLPPCFTDIVFLPNQDP